MLDGGNFILDKEHSNPETGNYFYTMNPTKGSGSFKLYFFKDMFSLETRDFMFYEDHFLESPQLDFLSVHYYASVSGEELRPYYQLSPNTLRIHTGGGNMPLQMMFHKNIPIQSVSISILPNYYKQYLKEKFRDEYINPFDAFKQITLETDFPDIVVILKQMQHFQGCGLTAKMFYEGKVLEVLSLIMERAKLNQRRPQKVQLSKEDIQNLQAVAVYIDNHYSFAISLDQLSHIAFMGVSKLKSSFKEYYGCSISNYILQKRIGQAQHLLIGTNLSIRQIAKVVGYERSDSFSKQFQKNTGLLPYEFKKMYTPNLQPKDRTSCQKLT